MKTLEYSTPQPESESIASTDDQAREIAQLNNFDEIEQRVTRTLRIREGALVPGGKRVIHYEEDGTMVQVDTVTYKQQYSGTVENVPSVSSSESTTAPDATESAAQASEKELQEPRARASSKLGNFASRLSRFGHAFGTKASTLPGRIGARVWQMPGDIATGAQKVWAAYQKPLEKMSSQEKDSRTKKTMKLLGRSAYRTTVGMTVLAGAVAAYGGARAAAAGIDHIFVPGTSAAPDTNVVTGNRMTLGYDADAGPFIGDTPYNQSVSNGVQNLIDALHSTGAKNIDGYSQGADVAREAVSKLSPQEQAQLVLNLGGDPSGEKGILTLAHDSPQGQLMTMLGFDTSPVKDTGAARINETRVSNDLMADASYTFFDAKKFNTTVESGDMVGALRMLANTGEKTGGYLTTHSGALDVLSQDRATYNPASPGNATVTREQTANGTLTTITPRVTAGEGLLAKYTGIRLTPEARTAYEAFIDPNTSNAQVISKLGNAATEGINNTTWLPNEAKQGAGTVVNAVTGVVGQNFNTPSGTTADQAPVVQQAAAPVEQITQQPVVQNTVTQVQRQVEQAAPQLKTPIAQGKALLNQFGIKLP